MIGKITSPREIVLNWGTANDLRRTLTNLRFTNWHGDSLTRSERRAIERANWHIEAAAEEIRSVLPSLSERSKQLGYNHPEYVNGQRILLRTEHNA